MTERPVPLEGAELPVLKFQESFYEDILAVRKMILERDKSGRVLSAPLLAIPKIL